MKARKVVIIGASGQLGSDLVKVLPNDSHFQLFPLTHQDIEITDPDNFAKVLDRIKPDIVINTAAYHRVDEVEDNPQKAFLVNSIANMHLAQYCQKSKKTLVFFSTDYVFGIDRKRKKPYKETDAPGPINVYGISKLSGEYCIRYICSKYFIVRTSGLFGVAGSSGKGGNFVETMLRLAREKGEVNVVNDQILSPTYTKNLAENLKELLKTDYFGLYHITSEGRCSWYEFAKAIFDLTNTKVKLTPVTSAEFSTRARRPYFSVLENYNLKKLGLNKMKHWKKGLREYLKEKGYI